MPHLCSKKKKRINHNTGTHRVDSMKQVHQVETNQKRTCRNDRFFLIGLSVRQHSISCITRG